MRRGRENQSQSERFERATPIWTRSSDFHTGPRRVSCRTMRPDTRKRLTTCVNPKKPLASTGASTHDRLVSGLAVLGLAPEAGVGDLIAGQIHEARNPVPIVYAEWLGSVARAGRQGLQPVFEAGETLCRAQIGTAKASHRRSCSNAMSHSCLVIRLPSH